MSEPTAPQRPYEAMEEWAEERITLNAIPSPDTLKQVELALYAIQEHLVDQIKDALTAIVYEADRQTVPRLPDDAPRAVSFEDVGRLIAWTDDMRMGCSFLSDSLAEIVVTVHEQLVEIAEGYAPPDDGGGDWRARMRRFHGLADSL